MHVCKRKGDEEVCSINTHFSEGIGDCATARTRYPRTNKINNESVGEIVCFCSDRARTCDNRAQLFLLGLEE